MFNRFQLLAFVAGLSISVVSYAEPGSSAKIELKRTIDRAIHADGPFLLPTEQALIARKCGYAAGAWDGRSFNMTDGVLICTNGKRVDDPEVRAMMEVAKPRIRARVDKAMNRPEVREAIAAVAAEASAEALARLRAPQAR